MIFALALALLLAPPQEVENSAEERVTGKPPLGGRNSGGVPPPRVAGMTFDGQDRPSNLGLRLQRDGSYSYVDPGRMFTAKVMPDGRVRFADRWRRPDAGNQQHGKCCGKPPEGVLVAINPFVGVPIRGPLEWLTMAVGNDLATGAKMALLKETRKFRTQLAIAWTRDQVAKRLRELPAELLALWGDTKISDTRKREILFERWDECEDELGVPMDGLPPDAVPEVDEMRRRAANNARKTIEQFIRRNAPTSGDRGFDDAELRRYNHRRVSVRNFTPYDDQARD